MEKYFKDERKQEIRLSKYLKAKDYFKEMICREEDRVRRTSYLIEVLGDVPMDEELYKMYIGQFQCFGGKYDVRVRQDTLKGIYDITRRYSYLTDKAIEEIWFRYIKDLFDEFQLISVFDKYITMFGQTDEAFELFIDYVDKKAAVQQQKYIDETLQVEELSTEYSKNFIEHIKRLITSQHYTYDEIKKYLPSSELITMDEQQIRDISAQTRIFFGCCLPVSYTMFDILIEDKTLDTYTETPTYYISTGKSVQATFTKQEFLDSIIRKQKIKGE